MLGQSLSSPSPEQEGQGGREEEAPQAFASVKFWVLFGVSRGAAGELPCPSQGGS